MKPFQIVLHDYKKLIIHVISRIEYFVNLFPLLQDNVTGLYRKKYVLWQFPVITHSVHFCVSSDIRFIISPKLVLFTGPKQLSYFAKAWTVLILTWAYFIYLKSNKLWIIHFSAWKNGTKVHAQRTSSPERTTYYFSKTTDDEPQPYFCLKTFNCTIYY